MLPLNCVKVGQEAYGLVVEPSYGAYGRKASGPNRRLTSPTALRCCLSRAEFDTWVWHAQSQLASKHTVHRNENELSRPYELKGSAVTTGPDAFTGQRHDGYCVYHYCCSLELSNRKENKDTALQIHIQGVQTEDIYLHICSSVSDTWPKGSKNLWGTHRWWKTGLWPPTLSMFIL